jgi:hypothetical protein
MSNPLNIITSGMHIVLGPSSWMHEKYARMLYLSFLHDLKRELPYIDVPLIHPIQKNLTPYRFVANSSQNTLDWTNEGSLMLIPMSNQSKIVPSRLHTISRL